MEQNAADARSTEKVYWTREGDGPSWNHLKEGATRVMKWLFRRAFHAQVHSRNLELQGEARTASQLKFGFSVQRMLESLSGKCASGFL